MIDSIQTKQKWANVMFHSPNSIYDMSISLRHKSSGDTSGHCPPLRCLPHHHRHRILRRRRRLPHHPSIPWARERFRIRQHKWVTRSIITISTSSWHSFKWAITIPWPSGMVPSTPINLPSFRNESIWKRASWYWVEIISYPTTIDIKRAEELRLGAWFAVKWTHRIEVSRTEWATIFEHFIQALLDGRKFVRLETLATKEKLPHWTYNRHQLLRNRLTRRQKSIYKAITSP